MDRISRKQIIEDTLERGFQASEMRFLSKEPTTYRDLKKEILANKNITEDLKSGISEIVRDSIDVQVKKSLDHGGSSFLKELQSLRFSNLDEQTEILKEQRKSMRRIGVQLIELDDQGNVHIVEKKRDSHAEFSDMMNDILGKDGFSSEAKAEKMVGSARNNFADTEPDKDFLFESQEMEGRFFSRSSKKMRDTPSIKKSRSIPKIPEAENMDMSEYYDNIFSSFLAFSNAHARNSTFNLGNASNARPLRESHNHRRIDVSSGLSQFLKSKIDSFVDEFTNNPVYKRGTVESLIKGVSVMKSEVTIDAEKEAEFKALKLDDDPREKLILSDLEPIKEDEQELNKRKKQEK